VAFYGQACKASPGRAYEQGENGGRGEEKKKKIMTVKARNRSPDSGLGRPIRNYQEEAARGRNTKEVR